MMVDRIGREALIPVARRIAEFIRDERDASAGTTAIMNLVMSVTVPPSLTPRKGMRQIPDTIFLDCNYGWEHDFPLAQKAVITLSREDAEDRGGAPVWQEYRLVSRGTKP